MATYLLSICYLYNYPEDGKHLELFHDIPNCEIDKGRDTFYYGDNDEKESKSYLWYVYFEPVSLCGEVIKGFRDVNKAYNWALKTYRNALALEIKRIDDLEHLKEQ